MFCWRRNAVPGSTELVALRERVEELEQKVQGLEKAIAQLVREKPKKEGK